MGVKGHWIRPRYVSRETYGKNYDMAFGEKPEEPPESKPPDTLPSAEAGRRAADSEKEDE